MRSGVVKSEDSRVPGRRGIAARRDRARTTRSSLLAAESARREAIMVDDFAPSEFVSVAPDGPGQNGEAVTER